MEFQQPPIIKIIFTILLVALIGGVARLVDSLILKPGKIRSKLRKQGIGGPKSSLLFGNIFQVKEMRSKVLNLAPERVDEITHRSSYFGFAFLAHWVEEYGPIFTFRLGNLQILHLNHPDVVKDINKYTSLDLGKPSYQQKELGPLLGRGILTSNGDFWAYQRKLIAPELYVDKIKGMINLMTECSITLINEWNAKIEAGNGVAEIKIDDYLKRFSRDVISWTCFGSNYESGEEIFIKLRALHTRMSSGSSLGVPLMRYLPTKKNREIWRLEKEVHGLILKTTEKTSNEDLLSMIREGAKSSGLSRGAIDNFIADNCKNIYMAGYETTAVALSWALMLLALHPEWQEKARAEVLHVCHGRLPDADMMRKMKVLNMVIHESLRLYPPVPLISREAFEDMKFGDINVPKGAYVWTSLLTLHQNVDFWGPDANHFNPERFVNGVSGACKYPYVYMPFGVGPRICVGQHFAMTELKILLTLVLSNFTFSLSTNYQHYPIFKLIVEPKFGVDLLVKKL